MAQAIPKEVLAVLPTDPHEQLKLAHKIGSRAYAQKVSSLESEVGHLRRVLADKDSHIRTLETRLTSYQLELQEALDKARASTDAQSKLAGEKAALVGTVRSLNKHVAKLEGFKRNLLTSLQASEEAVDELGGGFAAADLAGEALVQEALQQEQLHATPHRATSPYRGNGPTADGRTDFRHTMGHTPAPYTQANGKHTPATARSHGGSGGTSPAAGYGMHAPPHQGNSLGGYETASRPLDQHAKSGYGSPLDLPRGDYSNMSELSAGFEAEGQQLYGSHQQADLHLPANSYGAADSRTPTLGRHTTPVDPYSGTGGGDAARGTPQEYGSREPVLAREPPARGFGDGSAAAAAGHGGRMPDQAPFARDGGGRDGHSAHAAPAAGRQGTPLDGKEFFRRARARLATEPFARFLAAIKELNSGQRTRGDTLRLARDVFGPRDADLYTAFEALLNRHLPAQ
ncbi:hypothetical protein COCSUDRAFT_28432 [Coccomyxa subellipsoidea C-169]|uniref:At4g15545-like C-terminal domain-containing protein n=1 Tax=Coccomyxa subellipsoidea (strain C-169) TaxID=574566 RepID=I0Z2L2_COCSC|nr:hypothetical protein COCSUDRAFT_28432 [Coccomyxa subellipsoidea C-169]EIE24881.1 hypothetical protein COCSUDRAFT_28432 [Coccomyxa subellipsoidea C-169]|eukprot:XP_005649425.1 hypothetical protein COCSUDRAFT_28432 [Coccomyxa subellipsoidea C-169]